MKLATLKDGSRDGQLIVVSRDLATAHIADAIAPTLQRALDDWTFASPQLEDLYQTLNHGKLRHAFPFDPRRCMAPLPRAFQWVDASAYLNHVALVRKARNAPMPESLLTDPLMYQGGSDAFIGPCDDALFGSEDWGIDFEAEFAAVIDDVPMGATPEQCAARIRLLMLANDWSLRNLIPDELAKGFGFVLGKPATGFAPIAVTPDEIGNAWRDGTVHLPVQVHWNGTKVCDAQGGVGAQFGLHQLVAHLVRTRFARAGTIVGSGTVSNEDPARGFACIAEKRARETIADGNPGTGYLRFGDRVRIEVLDALGTSVFGAIDQQVARSPV